MLGTLSASSRSFLQTFKELTKALFVELDVLTGLELPAALVDLRKNVLLLEEPGNHCLRIDILVRLAPDGRVARNEGIVVRR